MAINQLLGNQGILLEQWKLHWDPQKKRKNKQTLKQFKSSPSPAAAIFLEGFEAILTGFFWWATSLLLCPVRLIYVQHWGIQGIIHCGAAGLVGTWMNYILFEFEEGSLRKLHFEKAIKWVLNVYLFFLVFFTVAESSNFKEAFSIFEAET